MDPHSYGACNPKYCDICLRQAINSITEEMELIGYADPIAMGLKASVYRQTIRKQAERARKVIQKLMPYLDP